MPKIKVGSSLLFPWKLAMTVKDDELSVAGGSQQDQADLPAYSQTLQPSTQYTPSEHAEHATVLNDDDGNAYCTLKVLSRSASTKSLPILMEGEPVTGSIELHLKKADPIKAVTISVRLYVYTSKRTEWTNLRLNIV